MEGTITPRTYQPISSRIYSMLLQMSGQKVARCKLVFLRLCSEDKFPDRDIPYIDTSQINGVILCVYQSSASVYHTSY